MEGHSGALGYPTIGAGCCLKFWNSERKSNKQSEKAEYIAKTTERKSEENINGKKNGSGKVRRRKYFKAILSNRYLQIDEIDKALESSRWDIGDVAIRQIPKEQSGDQLQRNIYSSNNHDLAPTFSMFLVNTRQKGAFPSIRYGQQRFPRGSWKAPSSCYEMVTGGETIWCLHNWCLKFWVAATWSIHTQRPQITTSCLEFTRHQSWDYYRLTEWYFDICLSIVLWLLWSSV